MIAYEDMISNTATEDAPWYVCLRTTSGLPGSSSRRRSSTRWHGWISSTRKSLSAFKGAHRSEGSTDRGDTNPHPGDDVKLRRAVNVARAPSLDLIRHRRHQLVNQPLQPLISVGPFVRAISTSTVFGVWVDPTIPGESAQWSKVPAVAEGLPACPLLGATEAPRQNAAHEQPPARTNQSLSS